MRVRFKEIPWDLYLSIGYAIPVTAALLIFAVGSPLAILLIVLVPGYNLAALLFPRNGDIDWIERIAISFGLSISVVPLLDLALSFTSFGVAEAPTVATIGVFSVLVGLAAVRRRFLFPLDDRLSVSIDVAWPRWDAHGLIDKSTTIALTAGIVLALGALAYVIASPRPTEKFTEFYLLGPGGTASDYPTRLNISQEGTIFIGIANHENLRTNYTVRADLVGVTTSFNATMGTSEIVELNRTTLSWINVTVSSGQNWTERYPFAIGFAGLWKIQFTLFKDHDLSKQYRELHLMVRIS